MHFFYCIIRDYIVLGAGANTVNFLATNGTDVIKSFTTTSDKINLDALTTATATTTMTGVLTNIADSVYFLSDDLNINTSVAANAAAAITAGATWTSAANTSYVVITDTGVTDGTADSAVYKWVEAGTNGAQTAELTLLVSIDSVLVAGDLLFA